MVANGADILQTFFVTEVKNRKSTLAVQAELAFKTG
jgi:hypothetical protein